MWSAGRDSTHRGPAVTARDAWPTWLDIGAQLTAWAVMWLAWLAAALLLVAVIRGRGGGDDQ